MMPRYRSQGEIWRKKADGTEALQLTFRPLMAYGPQWSPDGTQILFWGQEAGQHLALYLVPSQGGAARKILNQSDTNFFEASWSSDGKSIILSSNLNPAPPHIEVFDLATQQRSKLPGSDGFLDGKWSRDGKFISAISLDGKLMLFDVEKSTWSTLLNNVSAQAWSTKGSSLYVISSGSKPVLLRLSLADKRVKEMASLSGAQISDTDGSPLFVTPQDEPLVRQQTALETEIYALFWDAQ